MKKWRKFDIFASAVHDILALLFLTQDVRWDFLQIQITRSIKYCLELKWNGLIEFFYFFYIAIAVKDCLNVSVVPKIIYASRTHSQLSQAVQELKRTAYSGYVMYIMLQHANRNLVPIFFVVLHQCEATCSKSMKGVVKLRPECVNSMKMGSQTIV